MNPCNEIPINEIAKALTGIQGFDQITSGGIPRGKAALVTGGPGSGKTVFGLQTLANGVLLWDEPGIFVAFEEKSQQIVANAASFGWNLGELKKALLRGCHARPGYYCCRRVRLFWNADSPVGQSVGNEGTTNRF